MKIKSISLNNYRAFLVNDDTEAKQYLINLPNAENLLLYGENGSGKSSLYKGLKDFFASSVNPGLPFVQNIFYNAAANSDRPHIKLTLDDDTFFFFSSDRAATDTHTNNDIKDGNIAKGFISYRDLLKLHFAENDTAPELFPFFFGTKGLFAETILATPVHGENKTSYSRVWERVQSAQNADALSDYNLNVRALLRDIQKKTNLLLRFFYKDFTVRVDFIDGAIADGTLTPPKINFQVNLFAKDLSSHYDFLNEARLSSLAISVYFSYVLSLSLGNLKILFLDDIFIGLDMSNRLPLLDILTSKDVGDGSSFAQFQIFLTTYDREWFELAKGYLKANWCKYEFYVKRSPIGTSEQPYIRRSETFFQKAEFHFIHGDYPACANYLRKEFERIIKQILPANMLYQGANNANQEGSVIAISKQFSVSESNDAWYFKEKAGDRKSIQPFRFMGLGALISKFEEFIKLYKFPFRHIEDLKTIKDRLLNPLSHDNIRSSIFKRELQMGFDVLNEFYKIESRIIVGADKDTLPKLHCVKEDYNHVIYEYQFELLENLRVFRYDGTQFLLKSRCKWIHRTAAGQAPELGDVVYESLEKLCEGIFYLSTQPPRPPVGNFIFDSVYTEDGRSLTDIITAPAV